MPIELGVWRIDKGFERVTPRRMDDEARLEELLEGHIDVLGLIS